MAQKHLKVLLRGVRFADKHKRYTFISPDNPPPPSKIGKEVELLASSYKKAVIYIICLKNNLTINHYWYIMPIMKAKLIKHIKIKEDGGNIIEIKLWQVPVSDDKPHGYKYSFVYIVKGERVIGYDNAEEQGEHKHNGNSTEYYEFKTIRRLIDDFMKDVDIYKNQKKR